MSSYIELHTASAFSFLQGASLPEILGVRIIASATVRRAAMPDAGSVDGSLDVVGHTMPLRDRIAGDS